MDNTEDDLPGNRTDATQFTRAEFTKYITHIYDVFKEHEGGIDEDTPILGEYLRIVPIESNIAILTWAKEFDFTIDALYAEYRKHYAHYGLDFVSDDNNYYKDKNDGSEYAPYYKPDEQYD